MAGGSGPLKAERAKRGKSTHRKKKPRAGFNVDLTPLVDITFLLLTFFIFTTTLQEPQAMEMKIPPEVDDEIEIKASELCTIYVTDKDEVKYVYDEFATGEVEPTLIEKDITKEVNNEFKQELASLAMRIAPDDYVKALSIKMNLKEGKRNQMIIAVKFQEGASYGKIIEVLDDLNIAEKLITYVIANDRSIREDVDIPEQRKRKFTLAPLTDDELAKLNPEGEAGEVTE